MPNPVSSLSGLVNRLIQFVVYAFALIAVAVFVLLAVPGGRAQLEKFVSFGVSVVNATNGDRPDVTAPEIPSDVTLPSFPALTVPSVTVPAATVPGVTVPGETVPAVPVPAETVPAVPVPGETVPVTVPAETVPGVTVPAETVPPATVPAPTGPVAYLADGTCVTPFMGASTPAEAAAARALLDTLTVAKETRSGYKRDAFAHWTDPDNDDFDGRQQSLGMQSLTDPPVDNRYRIVSGTWCSAYDGKVYTVPGDLDVDHMVPLAEAWDSGAGNWSKDQREVFANDNTHTYGAGGLQLIPVIAAENRSKSDNDPSQWMPVNPNVRCAYAIDWVQVKATWVLTVDDSEKGYLAKALDTCAAGGVPNRPG